jgi:hypothetical protein
MAKSATTASTATPPRAPHGRKLTGNLGPGTLYPGAGALVQQTRQPIFCGTMAGHIFGYVEHPNAKDPKRTSTRFSGNFLTVDRYGERSFGAECYFPGTVERAAKSALAMNPHNPVPVSVEVWCEPDQAGRARSPLGYSYVVYDRSVQGSNDALLALAYETGIIEELPAPAPRQLTTNNGQAADPETGEMLPTDQSAAA